MTPKTIFTANPPGGAVRTATSNLNLDDVRFRICATCGVTLILHPSLIASGNVQEIIDHHQKWHATQKKIFRRMLNFIREG